MEIDAKFVLYSTIEKMGRQSIESKIVSAPDVHTIIRDIFSGCMKFLSSSAHDYDEEKVHHDLVVALMHYMLSACLIQAERKVEYDNLTLDIVIPSAKQLRADPGRTLLLAFPEKAEPAHINARTTVLQRVQPMKENIWLVFGHYNDSLVNSCRNFKTYVPDDFAEGQLKPFSSIIDDIKSFLEVNKVKSFKIFPS